MKFIISDYTIINIKNIHYIHFDKTHEMVKIKVDDLITGTYGVNEYIFREIRMFLSDCEMIYNIDSRVLYSTEHEKEWLEIHSENDE